MAYSRQEQISRHAIFSGKRLMNPQQALESLKGRFPDITDHELAKWQATFNAESAAEFRAQKDCA